MKKLETRIKERLQAAQRVLITSHIRPDGDAIGSSLALGLALLEAGKQVQIVLSDGLPASFEYLPGSEMIKIKPEGDFDLIICVDCSDLKRVGKALEGYRSPDIVIDHHSTAEPFGELNLVDSTAAATASVLTRWMQTWGFTITPAIATNLLTGLITDTIGFLTPSTTPEVLRQAAELMEVGVDMHMVYYRTLMQRSFAASKYWGAGLTNLQHSEGIVWSALTLSDRQATGYTGNDDADLITVISSIDDAKIAIMFVEQSQTKTKVSWRGLRSGVDVARIARQFGGGGHKAAAGAELTGSLSEVCERVLEATHMALQLPI